MGCGASCAFLHLEPGGPARDTLPKSCDIYSCLSSCTLSMGAGHPRVLANLPCPAAAPQNDPSSSEPPSSPQDACDPFVYADPARAQLTHSTAFLLTRLQATIASDRTWGCSQKAGAGGPHTHPVWEVLVGQLDFRFTLPPDWESPDGFHPHSAATFSSNTVRVSRKTQECALMAVTSSPKASLMEALTWKEWGVVFWVPAASVSWTWRRGCVCSVEMPPAKHLDLCTF